MKAWLADREHLGLLLFIVSALAFGAFFFLPRLFPPPVLIALFALGIIGPTAGIVIAHKVRREKPQGYIGRFRRTDGLVVHVSRLPSGQLMVISTTEAKELEPVTGPELARWEKLSTEPWPR